MPDSTPVKNRLIPAGAQMMSAWLVNDGCDFMKRRQEADEALRLRQKQILFERRQVKRLEGRAEEEAVPPAQTGRHHPGPAGEMGVFTLPLHTGLVGSAPGQPDDTRGQDIAWDR